MNWGPVTIVGGGCSVNFLGDHMVFRENKRGISSRQQSINGGMGGVKLTADEGDSNEVTKPYWGIN